MRLTARPARLSDIIAVLERPSHITASEAATAGYTPWTLLKSLRVQLSAGEATTVCGNGVPLFVVGHYPDPMRSTNRIMWFIATEDWFALGARSVLYGRRFMQSLRAQNPKISFTSISWSKHPRLARWFAFQGFELEERVGRAFVFKSA